jgi:hypothetical protein
MSYSIADTEGYRPIMDIVIREHCDFPVDLIFVLDIAEWASSRSGDLKGNPVALAVRDAATGGAGILIRQSIDASRVDSVLSRIEFGGFHQTRSILSTPEQFMRHLALHELAHLVNNWGQDREDECDEWAFDRLGVGA